MVEALNGEVITISATSNTHLNALDMDSAYGNDKNPLIEKSEFILSLFEQLVGAGNRNHFSIQCFYQRTELGLWI